jgi:RNA polymerase sigma factor (sigma-70 family)
VIRLVRASAVTATPAGVEPAGEPADPLRSLAAQARSGDRRAQRTLMVTLGPPILRVVRGVLGVRSPDLEDVAQEAMSGLYAALAGFRGECTVLHFACRITVQIAMNARRRSGYRQRYTPLVPSDELADLAGDELSPAEVLASARRREITRELLGELPPPQAEALALHVILGYSVAETSDSTGAPLNTVRSRLRAALAALRARVENDPDLLEAMKGEP